MKNIPRCIGALCIAAALAVAQPGISAHAIAAESREFTTAYMDDKGFVPRKAPSLDSEHAGSSAFKTGQAVKVVCEVEGDMVESSRWASPIWEKLDDGSYLPNVFVHTGVDGWTPEVPRCPEPLKGKPKQKSKYFRLGAAIEAKEYANTINLLLAEDCTRFVSWSLWYGGGLPMTADWTGESNDPEKTVKLRKTPWLEKHTAAAVNANEFTRYMRRSGTAEVKEIDWSDNTAGGAKLGDVIAYDWDSGADGKIDHLAIVTNFTKEGYPYVTQHSPNQIDRYWSYSETEHNWIEYASPGAKAYLIHIRD